MTRLKKYLAFLIIFVFIGTHVLAPFSTLAQEVTPTDTPTPTVEEQQATSTPTPSPSPSIESNNTDQNNTGDVDSTSTGTSDTGNNTASTSADLSPTPTATDSADITSTDSEAKPDTSSSSSGSSSSSSSSVNTGDSVTTVLGENDVNTNSVNSQVINQTINIFVNQDGDIDLSTPFNLAYSIIAGDKNTNPVVNVALTNATNYVYLSNDIVSTANTGENTITGAQDALIKTGNAYSVISFLNKANFTVVDSVVHIVTINIFGNLSGDIILPDFEEVSGCNSCGVSVDMHNKADVESNVSSDADTGNNTITTPSGAATVKTGSSHSIVHVLSMVNTNAIGATFQQLFISIFGNWDGNFLGWNGFEPQTGGESLGFMATGTGGTTNEIGCNCDSDLKTSQEAIVKNNILSKAGTGNNTIYGGNGDIQTGNAFSAISLANFINSNFFKSTGFFGFINVFGSWMGDVGGKSKFITANTASITADTTTDVSAVSEKTDSKKESGGTLTVTNKNNVGTHVNPGDTVTFFVDVTNTGTGKVYGTKLRLALLYNGQDVGGPLFELGDIPAGKTIHVSTGLVLSNTTPSGYYIGGSKYRNYKRKRYTGKRKCYKQLLGRRRKQYSTLSGNNSAPNSK